MEFLTTSEKIKKLRNELFLKQEDLQDEKVTRGLISMIETGKRELSKNAASKIVNKFRQRAEELNTVIYIDEEYLMRSPKEDAELYCLKKLENQQVDIHIAGEALQIAKQYDLIEVIAIVYFRLGEMFYKEKNFEEACHNYNKSIEIYRDITK